MSATLAVCLTAQWIVILGLLVVVLAMARQIGILYERVAPMGALILDQGPKVGTQAPQMSVPTLNGQDVSIGYTSDKSTLLFFLSPSCPVCKKLLPIIHSLRKAEHSWLGVVFASDGDVLEHQAFARGSAIGGIPYALSGDLGRRFQVGKLPYAVLIGPDGIVRAKGLVNSREQLESLITASELGVASVQQFIEKQETGEPATAWRSA